MRILCNRILHMLLLFLAKITYFYDISILIKKKCNKLQGTPGFEPETSRSAVECSATELYPQCERNFQNGVEQPVHSFKHQIPLNESN